MLAAVGTHMKRVEFAVSPENVVLSVVIPEDLYLKYLCSETRPTTELLTYTRISLSLHHVIMYWCASTGTGDSMPYAKGADEERAIPAALSVRTPPTSS